MRIMARSNLEHVGDIAVDAGIVMVGDPCYVLDDDHPVRNWPKFCDLLSEVGTPTALKFPKTGSPWAGVVVTAGYGDGLYPVEVKRDSRGAIAELRVKFL